MSDHEFDPTELIKVLTKMQGQATTEPYTFLCDNTLRPFYLLHSLKKKQKRLLFTQTSYGQIQNPPRCYRSQAQRHELPVS